MHFPLFVAWRYLFAKKSTNAINIITAISILGICIGTAALIIVLSVFNGFEDLLGSLMNTVNADVKVTPAKGKTFEVDSSVIYDLSKIPGVESVSLSLEETALLEYNGKQDFCILKGVDDHYYQTTTIDSAMVDGVFRLHEGEYEYLVMGGGIANRLNVSLKNVFEPVAVYMPRRKTRLPTDSPFKKRIAYPAGKFAVKQDFDYTYVFCSIEFIRDLLSRYNEASAIEINTTGEFPSGHLINSIGEIAGEGFEVKDRYEQNAALFKLMQIEKWLSFVIIGLILSLVSFNLLITLWMIVLDKRKDLSILQALGATSAQVRNILRWEGVLVSSIGVVTGIVIAGIFIYLQSQYGIIFFPEGFVVEAYPVRLSMFDLFIISFTVFGIGLLASILPARRAGAITPYVREE